MTTPPDPHLLADELLADIKRARRAQPPPVPFLLRSPELMALAPPLRAQVVAHARRSTGADPKAVLALLLYGAAVIALLFAAAPGRLGLLIAVGWVPAKLLHVLGIRRHARRLAADLLARA